MFQGRVMGVGVVLPKELGFDDTTSIGKFEMDQINAQKKYSADIKNWDEAYGKAYTNAVQNCPQCITAPCPCAARDEFLKLHPLPVGPKTDDWFVKKQKEAADAQNEAQKKLKDAESWRSITPIFSWTTTSPSGDPRTVKVYGYNKELKAVWVAEGPSASAGNSMLISEAFLASKSPEWVAWKSGSTSGLPLPLLLGAAYLLLA